MDSAPFLFVGAWLLTYFIHSTVVLGAAFVASRLAPQLVSRFSETMWRAALFGGAATASVQLLLSSLGAPLLRLGFVSTASPSTASPQGAFWLGGSAAAAMTESFAAIVVALVVLWAIVAGLRLWGLLRAHRAFQRSMVDRAPLMNDDIARKLNTWCADNDVRVSVSARIDTPLVLGAREVCLPARAMHSLSGAELDAALAHEVAHVIRRDSAWFTLASTVDRVLFMQPLNRIALARLRALAECACDDWALHRTRDPVALASALTHVTAWIAGGTRHGLAIAMSSRGSARESFAVARVRRILDPSVQRLSERGSRLHSSVAAMALAAVIVLVPHVPPRTMSGEGAPTSSLTRYTVNAHDDGGAFTLTLEGRNVVGATIGDAPVAAHRIRRVGNRVLLDDASGRPVLDLTLTESGGISWNSRPALTTSSR